MDTRFWGPSGWRLLHLISFDYDESHYHAKIYANFLETIPFVLPCKFCRASLTDYYRQHPYQKNGKILVNFDMKKWMYDIHNCVNDKLRSQGLYPSKDPSYLKVKLFYETWRQSNWNELLLTIWDFLFAIGYQHPKETIAHSKPMPNCPPNVQQCNDICEKNKWNVLGMKDRIYWYKRFWSFLPAVLPNSIRPHWMEIQKKYPIQLDSRRSMMSWLWRMRCGLDTNFHDPYTSVCKRIASFSSDCGKQKRAITCRKKRMQKTLKNKK